MSNTQNTLRSVKQEAQRVGIGERTLRRWIAEGKLTGYKAGKLLRVRPADVDALFVPTNSF